MTGHLASRLPKSQAEWLKQLRQETRDRQKARAEVIGRFALRDALGGLLACAHPVSHRRKIAYPDVATAERAAQSLLARISGPGVGGKFTGPPERFWGRHALPSGSFQRSRIQAVVANHLLNNRLVIHQV